MDIAVIVKVFILNKKGEILLLKRNQQDIQRPGEWDLPGGRVDGGETTERAIKRKTKEETGLSLHVAQLVYATTNFYKEKEEGEHIIRLHYRAEIEDDAVELTFEHGQYVWCNVKDALELLRHPVHSVVLNELIKQDFIWLD